MRIVNVALALGLAATGCWAGTLPKGCYEQSWSKAELKKQPLQQITAVRLEAGTGTMPQNKPASWGILKARFRDTGEEWLSTSYECSDTGAGLACATTCDGGIFVIATGSRALNLVPQRDVKLFMADCAGGGAEVKLNADRKPLALRRISGKACPAR